MSTINDSNALQAVTRTSQILVGAMAGGVGLFLAFAMFLDPFKGAVPAPIGGGSDIFGMPLMTMLSVAFGGVCLAASFIVPKVMVDSALKQLAKKRAIDASSADFAEARRVLPATDTDGLLPVFQTQLIVATAVTEGAAFFAVIAYMIEHQYLALGVAGVLLAVLVSRFPTVERIDAWLDEQLSRLARVRIEEF